MNVLFLHGNMGSKKDWRLIIEALQEQLSWGPPTSDISYFFHSPDLPGFGKAHLPYQTRKELYQGLQSAWENQWKPDIVIGYSLGARIALELSILSKTPKLIILESCHFGVEDNDQKTTLLKLIISIPYLLRKIEVDF